MSIVRHDPHAEARKECLRLLDQTRAKVEEGVITELAIVGIAAEETHVVSSSGSRAMAGAVALLQHRMVSGGWDE